MNRIRMEDVEIQQRLKETTKDGRERFLYIAIVYESWLDNEIASLTMPEPGLNPTYHNNGFHSLDISPPSMMAALGALGWELVNEMPEKDESKSEVVAKFRKRYIGDPMPHYEEVMDIVWLTKR